MAASPSSNERSGSTTWAYKKVKLRGPARTGQHDRRKPGRFSGLTRRDPKSVLTITVAYKGGAEAWWTIQARGRIAAFPGHMALHDVMAEINRTFEWIE